MVNRGSIFGSFKPFLFWRSARRPVTLTATVRRRRSAVPAAARGSVDRLFSSTIGFCPHLKGLRYRSGSENGDLFLLFWVLICQFYWRASLEVSYFMYCDFNGLEIWKYFLHFRSAIVRWIMKRLSPKHLATNSNLFVIQWRWSVQSNADTMTPWQTITVVRIFLQHV